MKLYKAQGHVVSIIVNGVLSTTATMVLSNDGEAKFGDSLICKLFPPDVIQRHKKKLRKWLRKRLNKRLKKNLSKRLRKRLSKRLKKRLSKQFKLRLISCRLQSSLKALI